MSHGTPITPLTDLDEANRDRQELDDMVCDQIARIDNMTKALIARDLTIDHLRGELENLRTQYNKAGQETDKIVSDKYAIQRELAAVKQERDDALDKVSYFRAYSDGISSDLDTVKGDLNQALIDNDGLRTNLDLSEQSRETFMQDINYLRDRCDKAESDRDAARVETSDVRARYNSEHVQLGQTDDKLAAVRQLMTNAWLARISITPEELRDLLMGDD